MSFVINRPSSWLLTDNYEHLYVMFAKQNKIKDKRYFKYYTRYNNKAYFY